MREWQELAKPILKKGQSELRIIKRGTFTELLIYMEADDIEVRPFVEELKKLAVVDLHGHPPGQGKKWPNGCVKIRIRLDEE